MIETRCSECGVAYEVDRAVILAGQWRVCPACRAIEAGPHPDSCCERPVVVCVAAGCCTKTQENLMRRRLPRARVLHKMMRKDDIGGGPKRRNPPLQGAFLWTPARELALELVCEDRMNDEEIAKTVGISRRTLAYWKQNPVFSDAFEERIAAHGARLVEESVALALRNHR